MKPPLWGCTLASPILSMYMTMSRIIEVRLRWRAKPSRSLIAYLGANMNSSNGRSEELRNRVLCRVTWNDGLYDDLTRLDGRYWTSDARDREQWKIVAKDVLTPHRVAAQLMYCICLHFAHSLTPRKRSYFSVFSNLKYY